MSDKDGSGTISTDELKTMLGANSNVHDKIWDQLLKQADADKNGEVILFYNT